MEAVPLLLLANAGCAAALATVVAAAAGAVRRPAFASRAWLLVLVKLVTPPVVAVPVGWVVLGSEPTLPAGPNGPRGSPPPASEPLPEPEGWNPAARPNEPPPPEPLALDQAEPSVPVPRPVPRLVPAATVAADPPPEPPADPLSTTSGLSARRLLFAAWLAGAVGWWGLAAARVVRFRRLVRSAEPVTDDVLEVARTVAGRVGLRRLPRIAFVDAAVSPVVWATVGRPRVLLPRRLWAALAAGQREAVLAHELAHLARGDHWVRRLELVVLGAYWWFPVAWLAVRQLRRAEEACCDGRAVAAVPGRAVEYAEALVEAAAFVSRPGWVPLASGGAARASQLTRRVTMILRDPAPPRLRWPAALGLLALAAAVLPFAPTLAGDPPAADPARPVEVAPPSDPPPIQPSDPPLRTTAEPLPPPPQVPSRPDPLTAPAPAANIPQLPGEAVERLRDDVELLAVQLPARRAAVRIARNALARAEEQVSSVQGLVKKGFSSAEGLRKLQFDVEDAKAQLEVRESELQEHELRIAQAKRRLDRVAAARPAGPASGSVRVPTAPRSAPARPGPVPATPPGVEPTRPTPASKGRRERPDDEAAKLAAERDAIAARFQTLQKQLAELKVLESDLQDRIKQLQARQREQDSPRKDGEGSPRRR